MGIVGPVAGAAAVVECGAQGPRGCCRRRGRVVCGLSSAAQAPKDKRKSGNGA